MTVDELAHSELRRAKVSIPTGLAALFVELKGTTIGWTRAQQWARLRFIAHNARF